MIVPFNDLRFQYQKIKAEFLERTNTFLENGNYILSHEVEEFEASVSTFLQVDHVVGVGSGLDALVLALMSFNIGKNDEVIVPSFTSVATALAVIRCGATPVFVDCGEDFQINSSCVLKNISPSTKAVIGVHFGGGAFNVAEISLLCKQHQIILIEDCAQAFGTKINSNFCGNFGSIGCFSLYPTKNLGVFGDGGFIATKEKNIANNIKILRDYGRTSRQDHKYFGLNSRLNGIQSIAAVIKLKYYETWKKDRIKKAMQYIHELALCKEIILPKISFEVEHTFHLFVIRCKLRNELKKYLYDNNIETMIHYEIPVHKQPSFESLKLPLLDLTTTNKLSNECLSLPLFSGITSEQVAFVTKKIKEFYSSK